MKLLFLCANHRQALIENPGQAIHCWQNGFDTGQLFYEQGQWKESIPHLGCALETAEIILSIKAVSRKDACQILTVSALLTANALLEIGCNNDGREILDTTIARLERELGIATEEQSEILHFLHSLYEGLRDCTALAAETIPRPGDSRGRPTPSIH